MLATSVFNGVDLLVILGLGVAWLVVLAPSTDDDGDDWEV